MGSLEWLQALARGASAAAMKFQHHILQRRCLEIQMTDNFDEHLFDLIQNALTINDCLELKKFCDHINITYL